MEGPVIGLILDYCGWTGVVYFMVILSGIAALSSLQGYVKMASTQSSEPSFSALESKA